MMFDPESRPEGMPQEPAAPVSEPAPVEPAPFEAAPVEPVEAAPAQEAPSAYSYRYTEEGYQTDYIRPADTPSAPLPVVPVAAAPAPKQDAPKAKARFSVATLICCLIVSIVLSGMTSAFVTASMLTVMRSGSSASANNNGGLISRSNTADTASKGGTQSVVNPDNADITIVDNTSNYVEAVAAKVTPSVVGVSVTFTYGSGFFGRSSSYETQASGVIYSSDGYIITNYHVIEYAITYSGSVSVYLPDDPSTAIAATIVGYDAAYDLAVLKIDRTGLPAITIGSSSNLTLGQHVVVIGNPDGLEFMGSVSVGYLSGINRTIYIDSKSYNVIQTDAAINPGTSGGAMVDSEGRLIGIVNAKRVSEEYESMGFAIPVDTVVEVCQGLITNSGKPSSYIGVRISQDYTASYLEANGYPRGIVVSAVVEDSPAEKAGIQSYDIITEADGVAIDSYDKLISVLKKHSIGEPMTVKVYRSGKTLTFTVTPIASNG